MGPREKHVEKRRAPSFGNCSRARLREIVQSGFLTDPLFCAYNEIPYWATLGYFHSLRRFADPVASRFGLRDW